MISEVLRKPSLRVSRRCPRQGPAHLITDGQMNEYNLLEKRSLKGGFNARPPGPEPTENDPSSELEGPGLWARRLRAPPLPQGRRCALGREARARRGPGTPRAPALPEWRRSLPDSGLHHPGSRLTPVRWGRGSVRSEGLGRTTTRRSESSARPPRNRRRRRRHHRPPLRAQRVEGPTASHAALRQRLAASAPPSQSAHWQTPPPLYIRPVIHWTTGLLKPNVRAVFGRLGEGKRRDRRN